MDLKDLNTQLDQQIAERKQREAQPRGDRRQQSVPVDVDRRSGVDRRLQARNQMVRGERGAS
jgi:hypothetical protein